VVVGVEFITEGDFAGRVPVALAVVRIWNWSFTTTPRGSCFTNLN
jgi:hypothetical protein